MATIVFVHAHPDDEASSTGGTAMRAVDEGHRVVIVTCTNGEYGSTPDDLADGETLVDRRRAETARSIELIGAQRHVWLGYADSGMTGWVQNEADGAFAAASVDEAGERLATVLREEAADVVVVYDWHGGYGHPDHVQVHRVGHRAAELAGVARVLESTFNRDAWARQLDEARAAGSAPDGAEEFDPNQPGDDGNPMGSSESEISLAVDVRPWAARKQAALAAHASQVDDAVAMASMPAEVFAQAFGSEWYIEPGVVDPMRWGWIFDDVAASA
ncbi:MAG: PIG-L deacetylase family protein [Desertimonas sp.]